MKGPAFGVHLPVMGLEEDEPSGQGILSSARKAEELGFDSLSVNDHVAFTTSWVDPISALASAASVTRKIKLGTSILNIVVRNPVVSATQLSAIDILSKGRLFAGVGPGSHKSDYEAASIPYEERWGRFHEALDVLSGLWTTRTSVSHNGKFYKFEKLNIRPRPVQIPHPPIIVGSWGSEVVLRRIATLADGWMASAFATTPDEFANKCKMLLSYRKEYGTKKEFENSVTTMFGYVSSDQKKVNDVLRNVLSPILHRPVEDLRRLLLIGTLEECVAKIKRLIDAGAARIHIWPVKDYTEQLEILADEITAPFS